MLIHLPIIILTSLHPTHDTSLPSPPSGMVARPSRGAHGYIDRVMWLPLLSGKLRPLGLLA